MKFQLQNHQMKTKWLCCFELWIHVGTNPFSLSYESLFCLCRNSVNVKSVFCLSHIGKRGTLQWVYQLAHFPQPNGLVKRCGRAAHLSGASSQLGQNSLMRVVFAHASYMRTLFHLQVESFREFFGTMLVAYKSRSSFTI